MGAGARPGAAHHSFPARGDLKQLFEDSAKLLKNTLGPRERWKLPMKLLETWKKCRRRRYYSLL